MMMAQVSEDASSTTPPAPVDESGEPVLRLSDLTETPSLKAADAVVPVADEESPSVTVQGEDSVPPQSPGNLFRVFSLIR